MSSNLLPYALMMMASAIAAGLGSAWIVSNYLRGITRQPEAEKQLLKGMILGIALMEPIPLIVAVMAILGLLK